MPLRYYKYCLGRRDYFAVIVARTVLAAPLLAVIFVSLGRGWSLLSPAHTFDDYPNTFALMSYGGWFSEFAWGATELCGGALLLACGIGYLLASKPTTVRRVLCVMAILLVWQAILSTGTAAMVMHADLASPIWIWFSLRFGLASLAFFQVVCVLQGECSDVVEQRLELLSGGCEPEHRRHLRRLNDAELVQEYFRQQAMRG